MAKTMTVSRSARIPATPDRIFALLDDLRQWERWSPWEELDPDMTHTYSGAERGLGAVHEWKGNSKAGQGRMEITNVDAPHRLDMDLTFVKPFKSNNTTRFELAESGSDTTLTWSMESPVTFMTRIAGIFMNIEKRIGNDFDKGLAKLSTLATS
jgi:uncharacterized protein YndB with AHSA1/START domain